MPVFREAIDASLLYYGTKENVIYRTLELAYYLDIVSIN